MRVSDFGFVTIGTRRIRDPLSAIRALVPFIHLSTLTTGPHEWLVELESNKPSKRLL